MKPNRVNRRGMTVIGCFAVAAGMLLFVALVAGLSGYFFYRNFGERLIQVRDEVAPVGQRFIQNLDVENLALAYGSLTESCQETWTQEKFASMMKDLREKMGRLKEWGIDREKMERSVTSQPRDEPLVAMMLDYPCAYAQGQATFKMTFRRREGAWKIDVLEVLMEEKPKNEARPTKKSKPKAEAKDSPISPE